MFALVESVDREIMDWTRRFRQMEDWINDIGKTPDAVYEEVEGYFGG